MSAAYAFDSVGTSANGTAVTPGNPSGTAAGKLLLWASICRNNADTFTPPTGWTEIHPHVNVTYASLWARIASGTSADNAVSISSSGSNQIVTQIACFSGDVWQGGLGSIVDASIDKAGGSSNNILYDQLNAPPTSNDLIIALGGHNKTATGNGATIGSFTGLTGIDSGTVPTGSSLDFWWGYQQQTTPAIVASGGLSQTISIAESLQNSSLIIALKSQQASTPRRRLGRTPIGMPYVRIY